MSKAATKRWERYRREASNVKAIYRHVFERKWPKGWAVHWDVLGCTSFDYKLVYFNQGRVADDPWTVIHELVHVAHPKLPHGRAFDRKVRQYFMKARKVFKWPKMSQ